MKLDIVYLNDVHGYLESHAELFYDGSNEFIENAGGYARISTLKSKMMKSNPNLLLFDGGDTFHGTLPLVESKGQAIIPLLNKMEFTAMVGHWDFAYGPKQLLHLTSQLNYPMLGINIYNEDGTLFLKPYSIIGIEDIKVAVIGICSDIIDKTMPKNFSEGLTITNGAKELPKYIKTVKEQGADIILLLSHNGFPQDMAMLATIPGIDVCLSAHTHNRLYETIKVNNTLVIQCGCHGSFLGHLQLDIQQKKIVSHNYQLIKVEESIAEDPEIKEIVTEIMLPYYNIKNTVRGKTATILHRYNTINSSADALLLAAIQFISNTEIAFSNGWRYGAPIAAGAITDWDLYNLIPMNPPVSTVELLGSEIMEMLEENLERTFSPQPLTQMGGYVKRAIGLHVNMRIENPKGNRIQQIFIGNEPLDKKKYYKTSFVTSQGVPTKYGKNRKELPVNAVTAMIEYLQINPEFNGTALNIFSLV
ncbi:MAG: bifunctional metallophosphatase/5'-nucleotidase [Flavobacterium sp.]|nr:bifunctional metallophosphatase/5'-nucleotidase [Flavobacterium sp.]